jgi:APA family basic amino acid/polyamine antiporter
VTTLAAEAPGAEAPTDTLPDPARRDLARGLGLWSSTALVVGTMIGTGIYLKPAEIARQAGSFEWALFAWVAGALLTLLGAMMYLELGTMMPAAGADYEYLKRGLGPVWGFLYGWKGTVIQGPASIAALAAGTALFAQAIWPGLSAPVLSVGPVTVDGMQVLSVAAIVAVCGVNLLSVRRVGQTQVVLTAIKVAALVAVIGLGAAWAGPAADLAPASGARASLGGVTAAISASLWTFSGWHTLLRVGSEVRNPGRTMPRAMIGGFATTAVLFLLINLACFLVLGFEAVAGSRHVAADLVERVAGDGFAVWFAAAMMLSALGSMNASLLGHSRVSYAMARDGLLPGRLDAVAQRTAAPSAAVIFTAAFSILLVLSGTFEDLTALFVFTQWLFFAAGGAALFRLRRLEPAAPRPVKAWGYPFAPAAFMVLAVVLTGSIMLERPGRSLVGLILLAAGLPVYRFLVTRRPAAGGS